MYRERSVAIAVRSSAEIYPAFVTLQPSAESS